MDKLLLLFTLLSPPDLGANPSNPPAELRLEVRASQSLFEPFPNEEEVRLYFRGTAAGYLTLYHIHPDSGLAILYPQSHHHWRELEAKKEYRLVDLADDLELKYRDVEGYVYLGAVMTREPIHLVPWLEQAFEEKGIKAGEKPETAWEEEIEALIEKVEADVRFRMGEAQTSSFALLPLLIKPRMQLLANAWRETPKSQRYFFAGRYHFIAPEPAQNFPSTLRRAPLSFPPRHSQPGASAIAPSTTKERTNTPKPPRREEKN